MRVRLVLVSLAFFAACCAAAQTRPAPSEDSARAFVESLYKLYTKDSHGAPFSGPHAHLYYHSSLLALMTADANAVGPGSPGAIDSDPICGCQDWEGIWDLHVDIQMQSPSRAVANVSFSLTAPGSGITPEMGRLTMTLATENGQWRIWDVRDDSDSAHPFDVRVALRREIRRLTKPSKGKPAR